MSAAEVLGEFDEQAWTNPTVIALLLDFITDAEVPDQELRDYLTERVTNQDPGPDDEPGDDESGGLEEGDEPGDDEPQLIYE